MVPAAPDPSPRPYFHVALNLPHAGRVVRRIPPLPPPSGTDAEQAHNAVSELIALLDPFLSADDNPPEPAANRIRERAAQLGRDLVGHIARGAFGHDRLGQCVRNFFERLELGREGAEISLRAGENPRSMQRPR
jgi:hypothetical protein